MNTLSAREEAEVRAANESGLQPVVLVHGLWLLAGSWDRWRAYYEKEGFATVAVDWPGDRLDVAAARSDSSPLAGTSVADLADHAIAVVAALQREPILIGHSFGGLIVQMAAGRGVAAATVAIDPAPSKGVLPLPFSSLKSSFPVLRNPANRTRNVLLTFEQFRYGFANAVPEAEARGLYEEFHVPGPGRPLFQVATANVTPSRATYADRLKPERGPMLVVVGGKDHIVPVKVADAAYRGQSKNPGRTEFAEIPGVGHSLVIDSHWEEVAATSLRFVRSVQG